MHEVLVPYSVPRVSLRVAAGETNCKKSSTNCVKAIYYHQHWNFLFNYAISASGYYAVCFVGYFLIEF